MQLDRGATSPDFPPIKETDQNNRAGNGRLRLRHEHKTVLVRDMNFHCPRKTSFVL
jgi:hypothetical protein